MSLQHNLIFLFLLMTSISVAVLASQQKLYDNLELEAHSQHLLEELQFQRIENENVIVYVSKNVATSEKTVILLPGARSTLGIWSRRITLNHGYEKGSMYPYVTKCLENNIGVVIMQPKVESVLYLEDGMKIISSLVATHVDIVAHSRGGLYLMQWLSDKSADFVETSKIDKCHLLDSVHENEPEHLKEWLKERVINWAASEEDIGKLVNPGDLLYEGHSYITWKSAGHELHEWTPYFAKDYVFSYII